MAGEVVSNRVEVVFRMPHSPLPAVEHAVRGFRHLWIVLVAQVHVFGTVAATTSAANSSPAGVPAKAATTAALGAAQNHCRRRAKAFPTFPFAAEA